MSTEATKPKSRVWIFKLALALLGVAAITLLVVESGPRNVLNTLWHAAPWLPLVLALEVVFAGADVFALREFYGDEARKIPLRDWLRSSSLAYGVMVLLPAGRAGGEVARAHALGERVGGARATATAAHLQVVTLLANTVITIPCMIAAFVSSCEINGLVSLLAFNGLGTLGLGASLIMVGRRSKIGAMLAKRFALFREHGASFDELMRDHVNYAKPLAFTTLGRFAQTFQYGVILLAVGGNFGVLSSWIAQGIHLVGAGLGDFVPNQVGVTEGVYRAFASELGFQNATARAVSVALIARVVQFVLAGACLGAYQIAGRRAQAANDEPAREHTDDAAATS